MHIAKDKMLLMNCCTDDKGSVAALGNVALCNNMAKSLDLIHPIYTLSHWGPAKKIRLVKAGSHCL